MIRRWLVMLVTMCLFAVGVGGAVVAQEPQSSPDPGSDRIEIPEAGMVMAFPEHWSVVVQMVRDEAELPPELSESRAVDFWTVLEAAAPDGSGCGLVMYGDHPLAFEEHAEWIRGSYEADETTTSVTSTAVELPLGAAIRFDIAREDEGAGAIYLLEADGVRYQLRCGAYERPEDDWLSIAETLEPIPLEPLDLPGAGEPGLGEGIGVVLDFDTTVSVVGPGTPDFPVASLMNADCAFALWISAEDGSAREWLACSLNDEPVEPSEYQGLAPAEMIIESGDECVWRSDYWYETDRTQVAASAYELTILPNGQVYGWSIYPADPLDCRDM